MRVQLAIRPDDARFGANACRPCLEPMKNNAITAAAPAANNKLLWLVLLAASSESHM